jgi:hypothetical protein
VGVLLWSAKTPEAKRQALILGAIFDGLDVTISAMCFLEGDLELKPALFIGAGAVFCMLLALVGLRGNTTSTPQVAL